MCAEVRRSSWGLGLGLGTLLCGVAYAEPNQGERAADVLFERAKAQLRAGDWASACNNFEASMQLDPSVSTQIKLARCREHDADYPAAFVAYLRARELNSNNAKNPVRQQELGRAIDAGLDALDAHVARVRVTVRPANVDAKFEIDGHACARDTRDGALIVTPGSLVLRVTASGFIEQTITLAVEAGAVREAQLELTPLSAPVASPQASPATTTFPAAVPPIAPASRAPAPAGAPTPPVSPTLQVRVDENRSSPSAQRLTAFVLGGAGLAALGCAGYFGVRTLSLVSKSRDYCDANDECTQRGVDLISDARKAQTTGFVLLAAGGALLGTSVVLFTNERARSSSSPSSIVAHISPFHAALTGEF